MNNRILFALCFFLFQLSLTPLLAIKAYPYPITVTQPDGTQLTILLKGDEFQHYKTSEDGFILKANAKGFLTYASKDTHGQMVESNLIAREIAKRSATDIQFLKTAPTAESVMSTQNASIRSRVLSSQNQPQRTFPLTGSGKSLVILVNFSDTSFVTPSPQTAFTSLLNDSGYATNGGTGSARDYFMASSYGKFTPNFDVVGPYTLPNKMAYYGANDSIGKDTNPRQMIIDACTLASTNGLDFTQYDTNNDGYVDNIFVYYAGFNEAEGASKNTIWPHRWSLGNTATKFNGKIIYDYSCSSELRGLTGTSMCGIGTFCHEFGHVLGLPDYYDTNTSSNATLNTWDIMDLGPYLNLGRTPPTYSAYDRFYLGYLTPQQISTTSDITLLPIYQKTTAPANTNNQAFLFSETTHNLSGSNPSPKEFFLIEYRKKTGWDTYLPKEGMLIWHIDYNQTAWSNNTANSYSGTTQTTNSHMRVYLQPLSGSTTTPGTAFTTGSYAPTSWSGVDINRAMKGITTTADSITFKFMPTRILTTGNYSRFFTQVGTPSGEQSINLAAYSLTENIKISLANNIHFEMKLSTGNTWNRTIDITPTNGLVNATVQLRYNPYFNGSQTDQLKITSAGTSDVNLNVNGISTLPLNPPTIYIGKVENSLQFPQTTVNTTVTKTLNIKAAYINSDLSLALTGTDAALFTASSIAVAKDIANGIEGFNITVSYKPTSVGNHTATLTISGGGLPDKVITINGGGL